MDAILLACLAGALFGALTVASRQALAHGGDPETGGFVTAVVGAAVAVPIAFAAGVRADDLVWRELWPFVAVGLVVPGIAQLLFVRSVRSVGASRFAVLIGTVPLVSVLIAIPALGERPGAATWIGTVLIVGGGVLLVYERRRPEGFRAAGVVLAIACVLLFAGRDNVIRWASEGRDPPPLAAASAALLAGTFTSGLFLVVFSRQDLRRRLRVASRVFLLSGLCLGLAYCALVEAFDRGNVSLVAPLNATQALWGVALAWLVARRAERVGPQLLVAAVLIVAGSAVIGATR